jgi:photosystem I subunit II
MQTALKMNVLSQQRAFNGAKVTAQKPVTARMARVAVRAEGAEAPKEAPKVWTAPTLDPNTPSPIFGGSTGKFSSNSAV